VDRSLFPNGTLVDSPELENTEDTKIFHILRDRLDNWELGIESGLELTVNVVNQGNVDLAPGYAYAPNGEYVEIDTNQLNNPLSDSTLGAINYVYAFYTETLQSPEPHETNGTAPFTESVRSFVIQTLTAAEFALLPLTDPTYAQLAQDRGMLVGIVTGTGGNLTQSNIQQPVPWRTLQFATVASPGLPGVEIIAVSDLTADGSNGQLLFLTGPNRLQWQAPGSVGPGAAVPIPNSGTYVLTALSGETITVSVLVAALPTTSTTVTVVISGVYQQQVPRMSSTDRHHRSLVGTGIPTPQNPHGLSINDITPGFVDEITNHQLLMHTAGIWRGSNTAVLAASIVEVPGPDFLNVIAPSGVDVYFSEGVTLTSIVNSTVLFNDALPGPTRELYEIWIDDAGDVLRNKRSLFPSPSVVTGAENQIVYMSPNIPAGTYPLSWESFGSGAGGVLQWGGGEPVYVANTVASGLFNLRDGDTNVQFYISNILQLPIAAGVYTDQITVNAPIDRQTFLVICQVGWTGSLTEKLGYTPNRGFIAPKLFDERLFGTLNEFDLRDDFLENDLWLPIFEKTPDGVAIGVIDPANFTGSLTVSSGAGLSVVVAGTSPVYVAGRRFVVGALGGTFTVPPNSATVVYVNTTGNIVTTPFLLAAFLTQGNNTDTLPQDLFVTRGAALALVLTGASSVTSVTDLRRNVAEGNVRIQPWSVGFAEVNPTPISLPQTGQTQAAEFYSLAGALFYASFAGVTSLQMLQVYLTVPIVIVGDMTLEGGDLNTSVALATPYPSALISTTSGLFPQSTKVRLVGMRINSSLLEASGGGGVAIIEAAPNVSIDVIDCQYVVGASNLAIGALVKATGFSQDINVRGLGCLFGGPAGAIVDCVSGSVAGVKVTDVDFTGTTTYSASRGIVNVASGVTVTGVQITNVTDLPSGSTGQLLVSGTGTLVSASFTNVIGLFMGSFLGVAEDVSFSRCIFFDGSGTNTWSSSSNHDFRMVDTFIGNVNLQLTGSRIWITACNMLGNLIFTGTCWNVFVHGLLAGGVTQTSNSDILSDASFQDCQLSADFVLQGLTNSWVSLNGCLFRNYQGGGTNLTIDDCALASFTADTDHPLVNVILNNNDIMNSIHLSWDSSQSNNERSGIWITNNTIDLSSGQIQCWDVHATGTSLTQLWINLHIESNDINAGNTAELLYVDNCTNVFVCGNTFQEISLTGSMVPALQFGPSAGTVNGGFSFGEIHVDDNRFSITNVDPSPAGFGNFFQVLTSWNLQDVGGGNWLGMGSFSRNTVTNIQNSTTNRMVCCLVVGCGLAFDASNNTLSSIGTPGNLTWDLVSGVGDQGNSSGWPESGLNTTPTTSISAFCMALIVNVGNPPAAPTPLTSNFPAVNQVVWTVNHNKAILTSASQWILMMGSYSSVASDPSLSRSHFIGNMGKAFMEYSLTGSTVLDWLRVANS
jgi:hypothetical protein